MAAATIFLFFFFLIPMITNAADPYYDYLQLALQNPKSIFTKSTLQYFSIHGFWPANWTNSPVAPPISIEDCYPPPPAPPFAFDASQALSPRLQKMLKASWPNVIVPHKRKRNSDPDVEFWNKEYTKHGSCTKLKYTPEEYFELADSWWREVDLDTVIVKANIRSGSELPYQDFEQAIAAELEGNPRPSLICQNEELMEVIICLDNEAEKMISCPAPSLCAGDIKFPRF